MKMSKRFIALIGVMVIAAGVLIWQGVDGGSTAPNQSSASEAPEQQAGISEQVARRTADDPLALGDPDAPVVLVEFADFRCPFCGVFARETKPELMSLVEDGTLRIEFRDLPIFGEQSTEAAHAARAAAAQGRFWEFYDAVFADAPERGHADLDRETLLAHARTAGVPDMARFETDMSSPEVAQAVEADLQEAYALGANSTPAFIVGDTPVLGAQPTEVFVNLIKQEAERG